MTWTPDLFSDDVGRAVRDHYDRQSLQPAALRRLRALRTAAPDRLPRSRSRRPVIWVAALAVCALLVVGWLSRPDAPTRVAEEIALNHVKQLDPEFVTGDFEALAEQMTKLDFQVVRPARAEEGALRLVGGRYCSIGDAIAVQARMVDASGRPATLYQFRGDPPSRERVIDVDGVRVTLWREADVWMGLAQSAPGA